MVATARPPVRTGGRLVRAGICAPITPAPRPRAVPGAISSGVRCGSGVGDSVPTRRLPPPQHLMEHGASVTLTAHVELGGFTSNGSPCRHVGRVSPEGDILGRPFTDMTPTGGPDASGRTLFSAVVSPGIRHTVTRPCICPNTRTDRRRRARFVRYPPGTAEDAGPGVTITDSDTARPRRGRHFFDTGRP